MSFLFIRLQNCPSLLPSPSPTKPSSLLPHSFKISSTSPFPLSSNTQICDERLMQQIPMGESRSKTMREQDGEYAFGDGPCGHISRNLHATRDKERNGRGDCDLSSGRGNLRPWWGFRGSRIWRGSRGWGAVSRWKSRRRAVWRGGGGV